MERDIGASKVEIWTLRALGMELEVFSLAAGDAMSWGFRGGELLEEDRKESVAMVNCDEKVVQWWKNTI